MGVMSERDGRPRMVIVDDDAPIRRVLNLLFEFEDFEIVGEAASGLEAIPLVIEKEPDLVILDEMMPGMSGGAAARVIRSLLPNARIVAFSAVLGTRPEWADGFLDKDAIVELPSVLKRVMSGNQAAET